MADRFAGDRATLAGLVRGHVRRVLRPACTKGQYFLLLLFALQVRLTIKPKISAMTPSDSDVCIIFAAHALILPTSVCFRHFLFPPNYQICDSACTFPMPTSVCLLRFHRLLEIPMRPVTSPLRQLLVVAGMDRLDTELTAAHMQGRRARS